jgi:predicted transcriptional regulator
MSAYGDGSLGLLGDPNRRAIFELLARRSCSVQELADQLPISRPAVSQNLRVLRNGGLVVNRAEGTAASTASTPTASRRCGRGWTESGMTP